MHSASPRAITFLLIHNSYNYFPNCIRIHVITYTNNYTNHSSIPLRLIRLSSPKLNIITVFGVIILYISMVLFAIPTHSKYVIHGLCIARLWFLALGVSLAFGTIIMKMFRVYIIFSNPTPKRKKVSSHALCTLACHDLSQMHSFFEIGC